MIKRQADSQQLTCASQAANREPHIQHERPNTVAVAEHKQTRLNDQRTHRHKTCLVLPHHIDTVFPLFIFYFANSKQVEPRSNHRIHRYEFQGLKQDPQETIDNFLSRLKNVAEKCKFKDKDERIVDQLIWGCAHKEVQKSLIGKDALQLAEAVDTARVFEATTKQMASLTLQTNMIAAV
uniref:Retrotransposon gag domain-containing protein n=1 Tax=Octopus bimaculoides TaxID=37653 RepID=A0A0L8FN62_OCTBM